jgi:hypothetical protein
MITRPRHEAARPPDAAGTLLHPVALAALAILVLNDHVLKAAFPGLVTGKLSDVAGVTLLPLVLIAGWELLRSALGRDPGPRVRALVVAVLVTGIGFGVVKVAPPAALAFGWLLGAVQWPVAVIGGLAAGHPVVLPSPAPIVVDPGDLVALPALLIAAWVGAARVRAASVAGADEP